MAAEVEAQAAEAVRRLPVVEEEALGPLVARAQAPRPHPPASAEEEARGAQAQAPRPVPPASAAEEVLGPLAQAPRLAPPAEAMEQARGPLVARAEAPALVLPP